MIAPTPPAAPAARPAEGGPEPRPALGFGGLLDVAVADNAAPRPGRARERKPSEAPRGDVPEPANSGGPTGALLAALAGFSAVPTPGSAGASPAPVGATPGAPSTAAAPELPPTGAAVAASTPEAPADDGSAGSPGDSAPPPESPSDAALGSADSADLATHLDALGVRVEVVGLAPAHPPSSPGLSGLPHPTLVDATPAAPEADAAPGDVAAALDTRALSARDGITVRVADAQGAWEIDVARHDQALDLAVRASAAVRAVVASEESSIRAAAARDGYHVGRIELAERPQPAVPTVRAAAESGASTQTGSNMSHDQAHPQARREELPSWPAPRRAHGQVAHAHAVAGPRAGRLDRDA